MLSIIDLVELEVLRITSAPPAAARLFPSRTISSAPRSDHLVFIGRVRNGDGLEACRLSVLHCQVPEPADSEHGHALMRLGICPAEAAVDCVTSTEYGGCLLEGHLVRNEISGVAIH